MTKSSKTRTGDSLCMQPGGGVGRLRAIMARLRDPENGCPWDIAQTFQTIAPYTIEEAYEVADAIEMGQMDDLEGELGDLLLQVVYHAQMGHEAGLFDFDSVADAVSDKMIDRHPHVFGAESRDKTPAQQTRDWEEIKSRERAGKPSHRESALSGVAGNLPALTRALKLQNRAARVGFDWPDADKVLDKIAEETRELTQARASHSLPAIEEEFGDLIFVMANLARHLGVDPENALRAANRKFERRFSGVEERLRALGKSPSQSDLAEMDALWDAVKAGEKVSE